MILLVIFPKDFRNWLPTISFYHMQLKSHKRKTHRDKSRNFCTLKLTVKMYLFILQQFKIKCMESHYSFYLAEYLWFRKKFSFMLKNKNFSWMCCLQTSKYNFFHVQFSLIHFIVLPNIKIHFQKKNIIVTVIN